LRQISSLAVAQGTLSFRLRYGWCEENHVEQTGETEMSDFWKKIFAVAMISGMGLGLAACETAEGFGQDMENAGEAIQDEASE
jgi:predicted small secreted protein